MFTHVSKTRPRKQEESQGLPSEWASAAHCYTTHLVSHAHTIAMTMHDKIPNPKVQPKDFTKDRRLLYYETSPCWIIYATKGFFVRQFWVLSRTKSALGKTGHLLSSADLLGMGVFAPPFFSKTPHYDLDITASISERFREDRFWLGCLKVSPHIYIYIWAKLGLLSGPSLFSHYKNRGFRRFCFAQLSFCVFWLCPDISQFSKNSLFRKKKKKGAKIGFFKFLCFKLIKRQSLF